MSVKVDLVQILQAIRTLAEFNELQLDVVEFSRDNAPVNIDPDLLVAWKWTGLDNVSFVQAMSLNLIAVNGDEFEQVVNARRSRK